jgi:hypothetical protein
MDQTADLTTRPLLGSDDKTTPVFYSTPSYQKGQAGRSDLKMNNKLFALTTENQLAALDERPDPAVTGYTASLP